MKPSQSIRLRIRLIVGLLIGGLVAVSAVLVAQAMEQRSQSRRVEDIAEVSRDLLPELDLLRYERGSTAGLIVSPGAPDPEELRYQSSLRAQSTPAMRRILARLAAISPTTDPFGRAQIARRFDRLLALRAEADAAIGQTIERRPHDLHARFIAGMTELTDALAETATRMTSDMGRRDAYIARMANISRMAWTVRAAAGDDSLRWWTADIVGRRLTPDQVTDFQTLKVRVDAPWSVLKDDAAHDGPPAAVFAAIGRAEHLYFDIDRRMRAEILADLVAGRPAPAPTTASRLVNTTGLCSLMSVADAAFGAVAAHAAAQAAGAERDALLALAATIASLVLGFAVSAFAQAQVLNPLARITGAMRAVADGDIDHPIPDRERPDEVGELARALDIFRDNARTKAATDEQLLASRIARETAEASARAKAQFLANMSHEIRTPLTAVIGFADLAAATDGLPETAATYTGRIQAAGKALLTLVNDILDVSRIEAEQMELDVRPCAIHDLLGETLDLLHVAAERKGLALALQVGDAVPRHVMADTARLRQVLLNLLSNAVKFTRLGGVTLEAAYTPDHGGRLRISVVDTGLGISEQDQRRLFQRFAQVDASNTRKFGGAGLGLAISKGLVELMGGRIGLESAEGVGSTFWFDIAAPAAAEPAPAPATATAADTDQERRPLRILVADDVAVNRELVSAMLSPFDLHLTLAASGTEAVAAAAREAFDLILMDVQMPGMDGLEATRAIRSVPGPNARVPILALSANVMEQQVQACRAAGMNDHIAKPIDPADLLGKIDLWAGWRDEDETAAAGAA